jgi:lysozyme family protein
MATERDFKKALEYLLKFEGGFNNIPEDSGGATNCGISLSFLRGLKDYDLGDLDHDGDIDIDDIRAMDTSRAGEIYKKYFWNYFPMDAIPSPVAYVLFDVAVNSGQKTAAKLLQTALGASADGIIGRKTLSSLASATNESPYPLAETMLDLRKKQYRQYVEHNPKLVEFLNGWLNRVEAARIHIYEFSN